MKGRKKYERKIKKNFKRKKEIRAKLDAQIQGTIELTDEEIQALQGELENLNEEEEATLEEAETDEERTLAEELTKRAQNKELRIVNKPGEQTRNTTELTQEEKAKEEKP